MKRRSFADTVADTKANKALKVISPYTRLPYIFDLQWDAKTAADLVRYQLQDDPQVRHELAKSGFDVEQWLRSL